MEMDLEVDIDGFCLSSNCFFISGNVISSLLSNVNVDISNVTHSLSSIPLVEKGKKNG